jgi:hypothetical protein
MMCYIGSKTIICIWYELQGGYLVIFFGHNLNIRQKLTNLMFFNKN